MNTLATEQRITSAFEHAFRCALGPAQAFFEIPQKDDLPVRVTYVVYAVSGEHLEDMERWFMERVVAPLKNIAGEGGYLYWRNPERVSVDTARYDSRFTIYTRIAVLDGSLEEVRLTGDAAKLPGKLPTELL